MGHADPILALLQELRSDFVHSYAPRCLRIRTKEGETRPLVLNRAQLYVHERLEEQRRRTGKVRAIILKGRQQGISTYVEGRFYHRVSGSFGVRAFVLAHEQAATDRIFEIVERFHENCPDVVRPHTGTSNKKELRFDRLDSGYEVATAGKRDVGRSGTMQFFHGSEVAFWPSSEAHMAGIGQTVPNAPGTEVILESTANGIGNMFHRLWQQAERGESEYIAIFVPWFWQHEYRLPVPEDFELTPEEEEYQKAYGLDLEQMAWRRAKIRDDFGGEVWRFRQEYPATPDEAFQAPTKDPFIKPELVARARKRVIEHPTGPLLIGVDPAWYGHDRTSIIRRRGFKAFGIQRLRHKNTMEVAGIVANIIRTEQPDFVFVDTVGIGAGVVDRLWELGFDDVVIPVNAGESPIDEEHYVRKRDEMWGEMRAWLETGLADIPDDMVLQADLCGPQYSYDSAFRLKLEKKEDMAKRGLVSPDDADALALTFAMPVNEAMKRSRGAVPERTRDYNWRA